MFCRCRPPSKKELSNEGGAAEIIVGFPATGEVTMRNDKGKSKNWEFDQVFDTDSTQEGVYVRERSEHVSLTSETRERRENISLTSEERERRENISLTSSTSTHSLNLYPLAQPVLTRSTSRLSQVQGGEPLGHERVGRIQRVHIRLRPDRHG